TQQERRGVLRPQTTARPPPPPPPDRPPTRLYTDPPEELTLPLQSLFNRAASFLAGYDERQKAGVQVVANLQDYPNRFGKRRRDMTGDHRQIRIPVDIRQVATVHRSENTLLDQDAVHSQPLD